MYGRLARGQKGQRVELVLLQLRLLSAHIHIPETQVNTHLGFKDQNDISASNVWHFFLGAKHADEDRFSLVVLGGGIVDSKLAFPV